MTSQEIMDALFYLAPNSEFSFTETDLSTLKWDSTDIQRPTDKDIIAAIPLAKAAKEAAKADKAVARQAILDKLGLTLEEVTTLLG